MDPTAKRSLENLSQHKHKHLLQNRVHYSFEALVNGKSGQDKDIINHLCNKLDIDINKTTHWELLSEVYDWLQSEEMCTKKNKEIVINKLRYQDYCSNDLEERIISIKRNIQKISDFLLGAVLHGSFADHTYVKNYSDVDMMIIFDMSKLNTTDQLKKIQKVVTNIKQDMYYIDPHQHHGVMAITNIDLQKYNTAYLPLEALNEGVAFCKKLNLSFQCRSDEIERKFGYWRNLQRLRQSVQSKQFPVGFDGEGHLNERGGGSLYSFKYFTSFVMLFPSLYFLADGDPIYKGDSFKKITIPESEWDILESVSKIRRQYPNYVTFNRNKKYISELKNDHLTARKKQQSSIPPELIDILTDNYFKDALSLGEYLWEKTE